MSSLSRTSIWSPGKSRLSVFRAICSLRSRARSRQDQQRVQYGFQSDPESKVAGVAKMRDTIESVFQVPIHGYILVDFDGFTSVIDEMGGVTIDVPDC